MANKHDAIYNSLALNQSGDEDVATPDNARFLRRTNGLGNRLSGGVEEKTLLWVDPDECVMWSGHNRAYGELTEANCRELIDAIKSQGRQEFPAVVRRRAAGGYEVVCGARRHFAVSWLRSRGYSQYRYLIEVRDLTDEEAFRLADVENRNREDISDYERALDYARALDAYYGGSQKAMAERLEVSTSWLSRYLALARLPKPVIEAFASVRDLREAHARAIAPLMRTDAGREAVLAEAMQLSEEQGDARHTDAAAIEPARVVARLRASAEPPSAPKSRPVIYRRDPAESGLKVTRRGRTVVLEMHENVSRMAAEAWFAMFLDAEHDRR